MTSETEELTDDDREETIRGLAIDQYAKDGEIEFDGPRECEHCHKVLSDISEGDDNGAYVAAWVWVDFSGTSLNKLCEDCDEELDNEGQCLNCADELLPGDGPQHAEDE